MSTLRASAIGLLWPTKARLDYFRRRVNPPRYRLNGRTYPIHVGWYNKTWRNERQVEIPPALALVRAESPDQVLEVGNVLSHYVRVRHAVIDKYELAPVDVVEYQPDRRFRLVVAISTLEHVGWDDADDPQRDPAKFRRAVHHLASLLAPGGQLWASVPLGHNPAADAFAKDPDPGYQVSFLIRGSKTPGDWREAASADSAAHPYLPDIPTAQAVAFLTYRASS